MGPSQSLEPPIDRGSDGALAQPLDENQVQWRISRIDVDAELALRLKPFLSLPFRPPLGLRSLTVIRAPARTKERRVCSKRFIAFLKPPSGLLSSRDRLGGGHRHANGFSLTKAQEDVARALSIFRSTCAGKSRPFVIY
jgi:hypothetical protein